ncbi:flagellar filament capping protein FliD, partial [Escherichia coli]|nr:flagellar filament capping protein FliD [Escherichia coli]
IDSFVSAYNDIAKYLAEQTKYDASTKKAGALQGDRSAVMLQNQLRSLLREASGASATYPRLSNLGLEVQSDGTLKVNSTKLDAALADP